MTRRSSGATALVADREPRRRVAVGVVRRIPAFCAALVLGAIALPLVSSPGAVAGAAPYPDTAGRPVAFGDAGYFGSPAGSTLAAPVVGMAATPTGHGYWLVASDGGVFTYGTAGFYGSAAGFHLEAPVVGMAAAETGHGYWLVASDGGIFAFGTARFYGSMGGQHLYEPVVGMASDPATGGYWEVAADGGIFAFNAPFHGSMGGQNLSQPVVGMASDPATGGYWEVAADGGIFSFDAPFDGSAADLGLAAPVVGMAAAPGGDGYWLAASDGGVFTFGTAGFSGSMATQSLWNPIVAVAATADGAGYWLLPSTLPHLPTLGPGASGGPVLSLQERLSALGYWVGTLDGSFGDSTEQAVYALQKAAGITPNGVVGQATYAALDRGVVPRPRSTSGYVIEVDLQDDLVMFVKNGKLEYTLNTSTGGGYTYFATGVTSVAKTPTGHFQIYREVDGLVVDSLGALWRPKFFDAGFAIHGDTYVPAVPVSHGCVRVSDEAIDWIWANNLAPVGTSVWVY